MHRWQQNIIITTILLWICVLLKASLNVLTQLPHLPHPLTPPRSVGTANLNSPHFASVELVQHRGQIGLFANGARLSLTLQSSHSSLGEVVATARRLVRVEEKFKGHGTEEVLWGTVHKVQFLWKWSRGLLGRCRRRLEWWGLCWVLFNSSVTVFLQEQ
jgi:hypothetical protein